MENSIEQIYKKLYKKLYRKSFKEKKFLKTFFKIFKDLEEKKYSEINLKDYSDKNLLGFALAIVFFSFIHSHLERMKVEKSEGDYLFFIKNLAYLHTSLKKFKVPREKKIAKILSFIFGMIFVFLSESTSQFYFIEKIAEFFKNKDFIMLFEIFQIMCALFEEDFSEPALMDKIGTLN